MVFSNPAHGATERAGEYVRALLELLGDREPLRVLEQLVPSLDAAIKGLSDERMRIPEAPGKWSVIEVVQHLADSELVVGYRIRLVLASDEPPLPAYDQDRWAERLRYHDVAMRDALAMLDGLRRANLRLVRSLTDAELDRAGHHAERGRETIRQILRLEAAHDLLHLRQIERIKRATG